jgi:hypothetical protein
MVWTRVDSREYPELCQRCVFYGRMGCAACTITAKDGTCKHYAPMAQEEFDLREERGANINE